MDAGQQSRPQAVPVTEELSHNADGRYDADTGAVEGRDLGQGNGRPL